jgi:hypothetical protein
MNTRNIKIDTISKTITFEKNVTLSEIRQLISDLYNYSIVIQEPTKTKEIVEMLRDRPKPSDFKDYSISIDPANPKDPIVFFHHTVNKPMFDKPTCTSTCFCSGKCKTGWSGNNSDSFRWNLNGR